MKSNDIIYFYDSLIYKLDARIILRKIKNKEKFTKKDYQAIEILLKDYIKRIDENVNKR